MNAVHIYLDPESVPKGSKNPANAVRVNGCDFIRIPKGTIEGNSSVAIVCDLPDGKYLFLEVTMSNFEMVAAAFKGAEERMKAGQ
jgi:hypothetical protein